jgi:hypothetical protein
MPFLDAGFGAAAGTLKGHFADHGTGRDFIE